ncbi:hypothetical protein HNY73_006198 [Argiope bruennichi]|uniref:Uncharacterized protein n=1 Tax=Argiope bruennichi TaxID=94029 RepID=A0A8T0FJY3_ARGBR|nr:hypothetical protein HNY73_006198 [Argiope bruennichi]
MFRGEISSKIWVRAVGPKKITLFYSFPGSITLDKRSRIGFTELSMAALNKFNDLGDEKALEVAAEGRIDFFITKLNDFVDELKKSSVEEKQVKIYIEALIVKNVEAFEAEKNAFFNHNDGLVTRLKNFCQKLRARLDETQSFMNDLFSQDFNQLSGGNQKQIYFKLPTVLEKMKAQKIRIDFIKFECETFLNNFKEVNFRRNKKSYTFINAVNEVLGYLSDCGALSSKILADMEKKISSLFPAEHEKVNSFIIKLKTISETSRKLDLKEIIATKLMESMIKDVQSIHDKRNEKTEVLKLIDLIGRKIKMQIDVFHEFKDLSENISSIMDNLNVDEIDGLTLDSHKKIFLDLRIVHGQRKSQIDWLKSIKSESEKFLSAFNKMDLSALFTPEVTSRQTVFNKTMGQEDSQDYFSTYEVLNNLTENTFQSMNPEQQANMIVEKLEVIRERHLTSKMMIIEIKVIGNMLNIELQSLKKEGTEEEIIEFLNDSEYQLKHHEEHVHEFQKNFEAIDSVLYYLDKGNIDQFSIESQRKIYVQLLIVRAGMMQDIVRINSVVSKWKQYLKDGEELTSSNNSLRVIWEKLFEKEGRYLEAMDSFGQSLQVKIRKSNLFLNRLKKNTKGWANIHLSSEDGSSGGVSTEDKSGINSNQKSVKEKEIVQPEVVQFSAEVGKDAEMIDVISELKNPERDSVEEETRE